MFRVARKIRVGRETGNTHFFFFLALRWLRNLRKDIFQSLFIFVEKLNISLNKC